MLTWSRRKLPNAEWLREGRLGNRLIAYIIEFRVGLDGLRFAIVPASWAGGREPSANRLIWSIEAGNKNPPGVGWRKTLAEAKELAEEQVPELVRLAIGGRPE